MSIQDHAEQGRVTAIAQGINTWPQLVAAVLFKFGVGISGVIGLVLVLGGVSWLLWGHQVAQQLAMAKVQEEYISYIKEDAKEKASLVKTVTDSQNTAAEASKDLADAVNGLREELRRGRP